MEINLKQILNSPKIEELGKKTATILPKEFTEPQKVAIAKAVLYIISADGVITEEEKNFFIQLCSDLKTNKNIMEQAIALSDNSMFEVLKTVSCEQEAYIMSCLNDAAYADNNLAIEEKTLLDSFANYLKGKENDFYAKILTF